VRLGGEKELEQRCIGEKNKKGRADKKKESHEMDSKGLRPENNKTNDESSLADIYLPRERSIRSDLHITHISLFSA
jgi:hypothetical protein